MKKSIITLSLFMSLSAFAQDHFSGISTSNRVGILNGVINPAEFSNLSKKFEVNVSGISFDVANNKIGFKDLVSGSNLEELIFKGSEPVNMRFDGTILGPSFAMKWFKWGFGITTKANVKFDVVDVDTHLGDAITNSGLALIGNTQISNNYNQRMSGTAWGEVGLSAARELYDNDEHTLSGGITFKFLFPGSYSNFGADKFNGTITTTATGDGYLHSTTANLNIAYSGNLAESFTNFNDYTKSIFGGLHGVATDIGATYQWKDGKSNYKIKAGLAIRNIGSMTFKNTNNASTSYVLNIPQGTIANPGLNLNQFQNVNNLRDVETVLLNSGYLTETSGEKDFKVNLPTLFTLYADFKIVPKVYVTGYLQQRMKKDEANDQVTALNIFSVTPRVNLGFFEAYLPVATDDISGTNVGLGFRLAGFYLGSSSIFTSLADGKQADIYTGYRYAFL